MRRREFIAGLGAAAGSSFAAVAQQRPRIGVLLPGSPDSDYGDYLSSFLKGMEELGYFQGRNFDLEVR